MMIKKEKKNTRIISIDPGRVNIITAYDQDKNRYYTLTRKYYYRACGMKSIVIKNNHRNLKIKGILEAISKTPTRSIDDGDWYRYQQLILRYYDQLWTTNTTEEKRRENFRVKRLKEKCLDRFLNGLQEKGESKPTLVYGAATINPTGKGELSVPIKYIYNKCSQRYNTIKVDERNTTLMHFKCREATIGVIQGRENVRGLRWCPTCRELVSRDRNACKNIRRLYGCVERPKYLSETQEKKRDCFELRVKAGTTPIT
jgi:transposase